MLNLKFSYVLVALLIATGSAQTAVAQTANPQASEEVTSDDQAFRNTRIRRDVQPIPYWVDTTTLKTRDNPVSGKVVGEIEYGQKILAYSQYENWIRVSKADSSPIWVNSDFLSNSRISWASYNRTKSTRSNDIVSARIKDPEDRKKRIFGVRLKTAETGNALITTREETDAGIFYKNRFVSCKNQSPTGVRLVGEGRNFLAAQNDDRNITVDIYDTKRIEDKPASSVETAISKFACKAHSF